MLTQTDLDALVVDKVFYRFPDTTLTVCCVTTKHGFHVIGTSACLLAKEFNEEKGKMVAYDDAIDKLWELEGYRLKSLAGTP